jgi:uncharacterized protein YdaU (DUF1376 family)
MNYYPFHLGDYATHTAHLEPMEDLAYRRMLDLYYRTESPLPNDPADIARLIRLRDFASTVDTILGEFFIPTPDGWRHKRCDAELAGYAAMSEGGKRGAAKRWGRPGDSPPIAPLSPGYSPPNANQEPRTKIQEETKTERKRSAPSALVSLQEMVAEGVNEQHAKDWLAARKAKRLPLTPTAWADTKAEALKARLSVPDAIKRAASNGWAGFKASWPDPAEARAGPVTAPMGHNPADSFMAKMDERTASATKPPPGLRQRLVG